MGRGIPRTTFVLAASVWMAALAGGTHPLFGRTQPIEEVLADIARWAQLARSGDYKQCIRYTDLISTKADITLESQYTLDDWFRIQTHVEETLAELLPCKSTWASKTWVGGGVGEGRLNLPQIPIGTLVVDGEEIAAAQTVDEVEGSSFNISGQAPIGGGYFGYFNYQFTEGDGSSRASTEPGANPNAITFVSPIDGVTGLGPSITNGLIISTHTDIELNDASIGAGGPLDIFGPSVQTNIFGGARIININRTDHIFQQFNPLTDINLNTNVEQDSWLVGPQAGISIEKQSFQGSGFTYGASGSISFLVSENDGEVRSSLNCPDTICLFPGRTIRANVDDGISSLAADIEAYLGYHFLGGGELRAFASVTRLTSAPVVHIPVNPTDPLSIDEDGLTNATVGVNFTIELEALFGSVLQKAVEF